MTTFTVSDTWTDQGNVNGTATFTPYPAGTGDPVVANITGSTLSVDLPVGAEAENQYQVVFTNIVWNGWPSTIAGIAFTAPATAATISLRALSPSIVAVISIPLTPPPAGGGLQIASCVGNYNDTITTQMTIPETQQTIIAPPSGTIIITYSVFVGVVTATNVITSCQINDEHGNQVALLYDFIYDDSYSTSVSFRASAQQICAGLTPGATYTVIPQITSDQSDSTINVQPSQGFNAYSIIQFL